MHCRHRHKESGRELERERESTEGMRRVSVFWSVGGGMHYSVYTKIKFDDQMITREAID